MTRLDLIPEFTEPLRRMADLRTNLAFFRQFLARPGAIGALLPSSRFLARAVVAGLELEHARLIVEVGPGTGIFTDHLKPLLSPRTGVFAVEINPHLAEIYRQRHPDVPLYVDSAVNLPKIVRDNGYRQVDAILSGLPWASFKPELQDELMEAFLAVLRPGGRFVTYAYLPGMLLPAAQRFRRNLMRQFSYVKLSRPVWLNVPPAFYYECRL